MLDRISTSSAPRHYPPPTRDQAPSTASNRTVLTLPPPPPPPTSPGPPNRSVAGGSTLERLPLLLVCVSVSVSVTATLAPLVVAVLAGPCANSGSSGPGRRRQTINGCVTICLEIVVVYVTWAKITVNGCGGLLCQRKDGSSSVLLLRASGREGAREGKTYAAVPHALCEGRRADHAGHAPPLAPGGTARTTRVEAADAALDRADVAQARTASGIPSHQ